jgi:hypothetical protein
MVNFSSDFGICLLFSPYYICMNLVMMSNFAKLYDFCCNNMEPPKSVKRCP